MLTISTLPEALAELAKQTGRAWTDSELLDLAANRGIELHAAPPITAQTTIQKFVIGEGLVEKFRSGPGHSRLAVLFSWQVGQLWLSGETMARHTEKHDEIEGEYLTPPLMAHTTPVMPLPWLLTGRVPLSSVAGVDLPLT